VDAEGLAGLRTRATDLLRAEDWAGVLALQEELRQDTGYWIQIWGPSCAVAGGLTAWPRAWELLEECVDGGFYQLADIGTEHFEEAFGANPRWPELRLRIEGNRPPPPVELHRWPCAPAGKPLLSRLDEEGEKRLAGRLPQRQPGAWATAHDLLIWVANRWRHIGTNHEPAVNANAVLDRVERGERFACREYTVVLTQALNAVQIPARRISLFRAGYYAGVGGGHAVTEGWIDDLGKWVLLDGQNGAIWRDSCGTPLGLLELQRRYHAGDQPEFDGTGLNFSADDAAAWFSFFHTASVTGQLAWSDGAYVPIMEGSTVIHSERLLASAEEAAGDLALISTGVMDADGLALTFESSHPYATGFDVVAADRQVTSLATGQPFRLASAAGEHRLAVATRTPYGTLTPQPLEYLVR
jgi:Transglutaminase-like superfamily